MGASLVENAWIDEQLTKAREGMLMFRVQGTLCHPVGILLPIEPKTPSSAHLYVFDSDLEAQVNMRCCIMDGLDREIVATVRRAQT